MTDASVRPFAEVEAELLARPWWRRPRKLRRQLSRVLVAVSLTSVILVGVLNIVAAQNLLDEGTQQQLIGVGQSRALSIERGVDRVLSQTSVTAADRGIVTALTELNSAFETGTGTLTSEQSDALDAWYEDVVLPALADRDITATLEQIEPSTDAGRYLQYFYTYAPDVPPEERRDVADAGDGSAYSAVHADLHPFLSELESTTGLADLLLVSESGDIVYSTEKHIDFGTNIATGPYRDTELATAISERLRRERVGDAVLADYQIYLPGGGHPTAFVVAAIRDGTDLIGALGFALSVDGLNAVTTANGMWEDVGLGTGESYVVGADSLIRSVPRPWLEDPDDYLEQTDPDTALRTEQFGSPIMFQPVDTAPVRDALDGEEYTGITSNYLGTRTFAYAAPIELPGVEWVMVAEVPIDDAREPLFDYAIRMLLVIILVIPVAALVGWWLARRSTRPVKPVVDAATAVAEGERDPQLPPLGNDEISDLGRQLQQMAVELGEQEADLGREFEETRQLLLTVLPSRLIDRTGVVQDDGLGADQATAISVSITVPSDHVSETQLGDLLAEVSARIDGLADDAGIERVRAAADRSLFIAGMDSDDPGALAAVSFARAVLDHAHRSREHEGAEVMVQVGLATGPVATGVLRRGAMTFSAWGEPIRRALAIASLAPPDEVVLDATTRAELRTADIALEPTDIVALDGSSMDLSKLVGEVPDDG